MPINEEFLQQYYVNFTVVCFDAKINFDDNAKFRQKEIFAQEDTSENDPREVEAAKSDLNYIGMTGNIGCLGKCIAMCMYTSMHQCSVATCY